MFTWLSVLSSASSRLSSSSRAPTSDSQSRIHCRASSAHTAPCTTLGTFCILYCCCMHSPCVLCLVSHDVLHPVSCILYLVFYILYLVSCIILYPVSCILYSVSCILYLVPCVLYLIPCCQSCCSTLPRDGNHFGSSFCNELQITSDLNCIATRSCCCMWPTPCQNSEVRMRWITIIIRSSWQKRILHR